MSTEVAKVPKETKVPRTKECIQCGTIFTRQADLTRHIGEVHRGLRGYECGQCGYLSVQIAHYRTHWRNKHTPDGEGKWYQCGSCLDNVPGHNDSTLVRRHIKKEHGGTSGIKVVWGLAACIVTIPAPLRVNLEGRQSRAAILHVAQDNQYERKESEALLPMPIDDNGRPKPLPKTSRSRTNSAPTTIVAPPVTAGTQMQASRDSSMQSQDAVPIDPQIHWPALFDHYQATQTQPDQAQLLERDAQQEVDRTQRFFDDRQRSTLAKKVVVDLTKEPRMLSPAW